MEEYECLKGDDTTYLVHVMTKEGQGKINKMFVLDLEQSLVTTVLMEEGYDPEYPRLIRVTPTFGAIRVEGEELPTIRHHYSKRMAGRHIIWHYTPFFKIQHIYHTPTTVRVNLGTGTSFVDEDNLYKDMLESDDPAVREEGRKKREHFDIWRKSYPFYEEPCFHIWIKDNMNVFCFVEENANRLDYARQTGGGGIFLLQEIDRLTDVGMGFSAGDYYMLSAVGELVDSDPMDELASPYDYSNVTSLPTVPKVIEED